jgi:hypothetical protein
MEQIGYLLGGKRSKLSLGIHMQECASECCGTCIALFSSLNEVLLVCNLVTWMICVPYPKQHEDDKPHLLHNRSQFGCQGH